jgi:hypothetical protein
MSLADLPDADHANLDFVSHPGTSLFLACVCFEVSSVFVIIFRPRRKMITKDDSKRNAHGRARAMLAQHLGRMPWTSISQLQGCWPASRGMWLISAPRQ